jgi:hypothetical protein
MRKPIDKRKLIGRDPTCGRLAFKVGVVPTRKDKLRKRNSKLARRELKKQLDND